MTARLITIPFSHYCEKARWALQRRGIASAEEPHLPVFHARATRPLAGRSVPLLVTADGNVLKDSTDILRWTDHAATGAPLFPAGHDNVALLEDRFDTVLGPHARRLGYFHLFRDVKAARAVLERAAVPAHQRRAAGRLLPLLGLAVRAGMGIKPLEAARSRARVMDVFADVEKLLADGRRYLAGETFTAADLAFASLAAPMVMPQQYQRTLVPLHRLGAAFQEEVRAFRATRAGAWVMDLYARERNMVTGERPG